MPHWAALTLLPTGTVNLALLLGSFVLLLIGAEIFTNGVEWLGHRFGVTESATGSILAAVGTALPETMIPVIAILGFFLGITDEAAKNEVGVGAILGAPFMLATIAMFLVGASVLYFAGRRTFGRGFHLDTSATRRDLGFFLVGYTLAFLAALVPRGVSFGLGVRGVHVMYLVGATLVVLYAIYVRRSLRSGELIEGHELDDLYLGSVLENRLGRMPAVGTNSNRGANPARVLVVLQTLMALAIIIGGAHLFVEEVSWAATALGLPNAVLALLLAPLATELPEKFNSVIWISRNKDTLAIGNITGAMAFQGTLPVTLGIVFTTWNLSFDWGTVGFLNALSAILAIVSGAILYVRARRIDSGTMSPTPFLVGGLFYLLFIVVLVQHVLSYDLAVGGH